MDRDKFKIDGHGSRPHCRISLHDINEVIVHFGFHISQCTSIGTHHVRQENGVNEGGKDDLEKIGKVIC